MDQSLVLIKKGITTNRMTNPLNPDYLLPGNKELDGNYNPYGNTVNSKFKIIRDLNKIKESVPNINNVIPDMKLDIDNINQCKTEENEPNVNKINEFIKTENNNNIETFNSTCNNIKPNPFFGFVHDRYIVSNQTQEKLKKEKILTTINKNKETAKEKGKYSIYNLSQPQQLSNTNSNFRTTNAQINL